MTKTKPIIPLPLLSLALITFAIALPAPAHAEEKTFAAPLHIKLSPKKASTTRHLKITSTKNTKTVKKSQPVQTKALKIDKAKKPVKKAKKVNVIRKTDQVKQSPKKINVDDILDSISCKRSALSKKPNQDSNRNKKLADSLKSYLNAKKQNPKIIDTLYRTSQKTGVDFELLVITAMIESDLGRMTISSSSSARGIYQYIEPTWLVLIKRYGKRIGYESYADAVQINTKTKKPEVIGGMVMRQEILDLRYNKRVSSLIKAHQIKDEERVLQSFKIGQNVSITDHYIAHMLGLSLARTFYKLRNNESAVILAYLKNSMFKEAITLNRGFFYDETGNPLNAHQAYIQFEKKISGKFRTLKSIDTRYGQGNNLTSQACVSDKPQIHTVSADDILSHKISPLPHTDGQNKSRDILKQVSAYAKTVKVPLNKQ